jgi:hypothetical protein
MPTSKKTNRAFRCTDTLYSLIGKAAESEEMTINQWMEYAARAQLKNGISKEGLGEETASLVTAEALSTAANTVEKAISKLERSQKYWSDQLAELRKLEK